ncbi:HAD hydrolase-like protein [Microbacterium sp. KUDC0406]|uniref:HAD hydrolase-like protein n=1 Tax=Microbacterium sp. KUDC0406 TaxID=2909588 RepID=UPI001F2494D8|nr:HAD hydrolase-like protein [Microbacterium sp. KUDC0406]UJP09497.1 HAD hydrolase-like protein [Microbacterium sp. KUDC0406]
MPDASTGSATHPPAATHTSTGSATHPPAATHAGSAPHRPFTCILWDVDGVIADASAGILPRLREVFTSYGMQPPAAEELSRWIGPPMYESFQRSGMDLERSLEAVGRYRELAARDGYAASVAIYPGIPEVLRAVRDAGIPQSTASSKPENQVLAILEHYELMDPFTVVAGSLPDPRTGGNEDKATVIGRALELLGAAGADVSRPVLVGDRVHDLEGAAQYGIPVIFAEWGFGDAAEGREAIMQVESASDLRRALLG